MSISISVVTPSMSVAKVFTLGACVLSLLTGIGLMCTLFGVSVFDLPSEVEIRLEKFLHPNKNKQKSDDRSSMDNGTKKVSTEDSVAASEQKSGSRVDPPAGIMKSDNESAPFSASRDEYQEFSNSPKPSSDVVTEAQKNQRFDYLRDELPAFKQALVDARSTATCFTCIAMREAAYDHLKINYALYDSWKDSFNGNASRTDLIETYMPYAEQARVILERK